MNQQIVSNCACDDDPVTQLKLKFIRKHCVIVTKVFEQVEHDASVSERTEIDSNMKLFSSSLPFMFPAIFTDINECDEKSGICGTNGKCINSQGSFECMCHKGFRFNGAECVGE
jgi:hypothetical protein